MKLIFFISLLTLNLLHPVHLSITNLEYFDKGNYFNMSIKLFTDDFENILNSTYNINVNLGKDNQIKNADFYITDYIAKNLIINVNNEKIHVNKYILTDIEFVDISVWLRFKIKHKIKPQKIEITDKIMFDLFRDQKNLLIFTYNKKQFALEFNHKSKNKKIEL